MEKSWLYIHIQFYIAQLVIKQSYCRCWPFCENRHVISCFNGKHEPSKWGKTMKNASG